MNNFFFRFNTNQLITLITLFGALYFPLITPPLDVP